MLASLIFLQMYCVSLFRDYQAFYRTQWSLGVMLATCDHFQDNPASPMPQTFQNSSVMIVTGHVSRVWHWLARHHANLTLSPALFFTKP